MKYENIKTKVLSLPLLDYQTKDLIWTISLVLAAIITPAIFAHTPQNQWLTGTLVNAILFVTAYKLAPFNAFLVAAFPSTIALTRGLLPLPMALLIPYIITANFILLLVFSGFKKRPFIGVLFASLAKFSFLYVITLIFAEKTSPIFIAMLQWPQLFTALAGGLIALFIIENFFRKNQKSLF